MVLRSISLCLRKKYDLIHAQGLLSGFVAVLLKKIFNIKVFVTLLALYEFDKKPKWFCWMTRFLFDNCDAIFVEGFNGEQDAWGAYRRFFKKMGDVENYHPKFVQFKHWVDQSLFCPPENRENDKIRVLFIGRPIPEKGRHIIQEAERILNDKERYSFVYLENIPYEDLPKFYQMAHIVVVPSLYAEGFSRVVAESASCGCAVIVSNRGSLPEMVNCFGRYINPTPDNFAESISTIAEMPILLKGYAGSSLIYAKENFSSKNVEVFLNEYARA